LRKKNQSFFVRKEGKYRATRNPRKKKKKKMGILIPFSDGRSEKNRGKRRRPPYFTRRGEHRPERYSKKEGGRRKKVNPSMTWRLRSEKKKKEVPHVTTPIRGDCRPGISAERKKVHTGSLLVPDITEKSGKQKEAPIPHKKTPKRREKEMVRVTSK